MVSSKKDIATLLLCRGERVGVQKVRPNQRQGVSWWGVPSSEPALGSVRQSYSLGTGGPAGKMRVATCEKVREHTQPDPEP